MGIASSLVFRNSVPNASLVVLVGDGRLVSIYGMLIGSYRVSLTRHVQCCLHFAKPA
jgi:hypothetical protein